MSQRHRATRRPLVAAALVALLLLAGVAPFGPVAGAVAPPHAGKATVFPADNIWNRAVTDLPTHPRSASYLGNVGLGATFHADFGRGLWNGGPIGIPHVVVPGSQPKVPIHYTAYGDESDPGPMPIPVNAPIEGGPQADGDRHVIVIDEDNGVLYELYRAFPNPDGSWNADSGARWSLGSNALRPDGWTSADAAGLPIFPGLARYDEVASGAIRHALRFTLPRTQRAYLWPARHQASSSTDTARPPMGLRFRLKADVNIAAYPPQARVILQCLKDYGMILADNGSALFVSGVPDERWDNDDLRALRGISAAMLEAVDESGLQVEPHSGRARQSGSSLLDVSQVGAGEVTPAGGTYTSGATVVLSARPAPGWLLARWEVDGQVAGYARSLTLTMDGGHAVVARFARAVEYPDVSPAMPAAPAIGQLGASGIIRGNEDGMFRPADPVLRAQMAALIARASGWEAESWGTPFSDQGTVDAALWRDVGTLAHYDVARGYGDGSYGPTAPVLHIQAVSFIARAMVARGWWTPRPDDPALAPNVPMSSGARADLATYVAHAGPLPATSAAAPWPAWDEPASRAWFAQALWAALGGVDAAP